MYISTTIEWRLKPFTLDVVQPAFDGGSTYTEVCGEFIDSLFTLLIGTP